MTFCGWLTLVIDFPSNAAVEPRVYVEQQRMEKVPVKSIMGETFNEHLKISSCAVLSFEIEELVEEEKETNGKI